jgi:hypothetical protein
MPAQKRRGQRNSQAARSAPVDAQPSEHADTPRLSRRVFVLGAGVDICYGVPAMSTLLRELASFVKGEGRPIHLALRKKLPNMRFSFERYAGDQSNEMLRQLFSTDNQDLVAILRTTATQLQLDPEAASIGPLIDRLCTLAENNQLSGDVATGIARFAGRTEDVSGGEAIFDPEHIVLTQTVAQGLRQAFVRAVEEDPFDDEQRRRVEYFIEATSNVEQLMSLYFMRYSLGRPADEKTFLYINWMLWAFLRLRSYNPPVRSNSIYQYLPRLGGHVITFNYTDFFDRRTARDVCFFHGRLSEYLRLDTRDLVADDPYLVAATSVEGIVRFIEQVRLDITTPMSIDVPSIVPPTSFKPVTSRAQLLTWARADALINQATEIVVVGYSFALADEHFNDLLRHANSRIKVIVVNPDLAGASREAARVLGIDPASLTATSAGGFDVQRSGRLVCVAAKGESVSNELLQALS